MNFVHLLPTTYLVPTIGAKSIDPKFENVCLIKITVRYNPKKIAVHKNFKPIG